MRVREGKTPKTGAEAPYRPTVEVVELDIRRFLLATDHEPDVHCHAPKVWAGGCRGCEHSFVCNLILT